MPGQKHSPSGETYTQVVAMPWSSSCCILRVRNFPHEHVCVLQPVLMEADREDIAGEPRTTLEMSGLSTEYYLVPDCSNQSPDKGKLPGDPQTVSVWPLQWPGRSEAAEVAALSPSKAPWEDLEAPKVSAVVGSLSQALSQVLCPREQEGSEVKTCYGTLTDSCYYLCSKDYIHKPVRSLYHSVHVS